MNTVVNFNGLNLEVLEFDDTWALSNRQVADGFGVSEEAIRSQKSRGEYKYGIHFFHRACETRRNGRRCNLQRGYRYARNDFLD